MTSPPKPLASRTARGLGLVLAILAILGGSAGASEVRVVDAFGGPGSEYTTLQSAIDAAGEGDLILIRAGNYGAGGQIVGKSLSISAEEGASVMLFGVTIDGLAANQSVSLRGCNLQLGADSIALAVRDNAGVVLVEDCAIGFAFVQVGLPGPTEPAILVEDSMRVVLKDVAARGTVQSGAFYNSLGGDALVALDSRVFAFESRFEGGAGSSTTAGAALVGNGGDGLIVDGGELFVSGCEAIGGKGGDGVFIGGPLLCRPGGKGGDGIELKNGAIVRALATAAVAGLGGAAAPSGGCGAGTSGVAVRQTLGTTYATIPGAAAEFSISSPTRESATHTFHAKSAAGDSIVLLIGVVPLAQPAYAAKGALFVAPPMIAVSFGMMPPSGSLDLTIPAGALPPGIDGVTAYVQPLFTSIAGAQLGPATTVMLLDAAL